LPDDTEIYYGDECGFNEYYHNPYGTAPKGERVFGAVCGKRFARTSVIAAIDKNNDFVAPFAFSGYMNSDLFLGWLENVFVPKLINPAKSVLLIDNASHHPKDSIAEIAEIYGFNVLFIAKYSPDLNLIEKKWANVKNWLRRHMHKYGSFWDALVPAFG
jgi:transposase